MPATQKAPSTQLHHRDAVRDAFVERYDQLMQWALHLTRGDREQAEDLLHEAFVQFALRERDLSEVGNIEAYLYTVLKHLRLASIRRGKRDPLNQLSLVEFDSVDLAIRSHIDGDQVSVQNDLRRVCAFLCWRKATTKSASYLILRFFHGYYPEEITRIALTSRNVVDHGIRLASSEAKAYLADPGRLRVMEGPSRPTRYDRASPASVETVPAFSPELFALPAAEFLQVLSELIFSSPPEECLPAGELLRIYGATSTMSAAQEKSASSVDRTVLAHLVSCSRCLDFVNSHLQIPPLSERFPGERLGSFRRTNGKGGASKGAISLMLDHRTPQEMQLGKASILRTAQMRLQECFEHQPKRLYIAVNGEVIAMQEVACEHNKQSVRLQNGQSLDFVEVFSEQHIRLAFLSVSAVSRQGRETLSQKVLLSAGRSLDVVLELTGMAPSLEVVYTDPLLAHAVDFLEAELDQSHRLIADLRTSLEVVSEATGRPAHAFAEWIRRRWHPWIEASRPLAIAGVLALLSVVVAAGFLIYWRQQVLQAGTLLTEAAELESQEGRTGDLIHRVVEFDLMSPDEKQPIQQQTVDIWRRRDKGAFAMKLSARDNQVIAAVWKAESGSYAVYEDHKLVKPATPPAIPLPGLVRINTADLWMDEPSAKTFRALTAHPGLVTLGQSGGDSIVDYKPQLLASEAAQPHLVRATLAIGPDRHVVGQSFWIEADGEIRHYRYRELSYAERKSTPSDDLRWAPDPKLVIGSRVVHSRSGVLSSSDPALEVNILYALHQLGDDLDGQVELSLGRDGYLAVRGTVPSEELKVHINQALSTFKIRFGLRVQVQTAQELLESREALGALSKRPTMLTDIAPTGLLPIDQRLRIALRRQGVPDGELARAEQTLSRQVLDLSDRIHMQAWTLRQMAGRFSAVQLQTMDKQSLNRWLSLIHDHAGSLHDAISEMDQLVRPLFVPELVSVPETPTSDESHSLLSEADVIAGLVSDEEHILSRSFVLSPQNHSVHDVDLASLWPVLQALDTAAVHITEAVTALTDGVAYLH